MINRHWCISALDEDSPYTNSCLFTLDRLPLLCCYAKTSSPAAKIRHSKVYGNPIAPSLYSILLETNQVMILPPF